MRYKIVTDNDGHDYVILAHLEEDFYRWVGAMEDEDEEYEGMDFEDRRMTICNLTFTDPQGWQ